MPLVSCHHRPDRSFYWKGKPFPVCARCTGLYPGLAAFPLFLFGVLQLPVLVAAALLLPMLIDTATQAGGWRESRNWLRFVTGLAAGVGAAALTVNGAGFLDRFLF
ncbi:MAG: DUF2085 domain-containing protein [Chitinophagaceae bacterium]|nr:MAG: DUF2085 domain-containing protein [Chitinophagaceae bacterium]